ncbi:MAG: tyrosine-type recombinase/integrase [Actinobacteria bacterium]|nr:tyrosine-type recombinase/integrase [Actinomycetota bacterium]
MMTLWIFQSSWRGMRRQSADRGCTGEETHRLYPAYLLAATTGMRRGEILGLKWGNVDLEAKTIWIRETLISVGYKVRLSQTRLPSWYSAAVVSIWLANGAV